VFLKLVLNVWTLGLRFNGARNAFTPFPKESWNDMVVVVVGCGPVALCAIVSAMEYKPAKLFAVDSVPDRLKRAEALGAIPLNFKTDDVKAEVLKVTGGRGADAVIEVVGHTDALEMAFDIVRVAGKISVIGESNCSLPSPFLIRILADKF
jgi:threonine dehydrogenase-like Zn-dependent dehydrogenase